MFDEARRRKERGRDVVVGALQPEVPPEIKSLLDVLEVAPTIDVEVLLLLFQQSFAAICKCASLTGWRMTAPGAIAHRWQDVDELLSSGITVVASVDLPHIDDQREAVEKLTGKEVTENIPRQFLDTAEKL